MDKYQQLYHTVLGSYNIQDLFIYLFILSLMLAIKEQILFKTKNSNKMLIYVNTIVLIVPMFYNNFIIHFLKLISNQQYTLLQMEFFSSDFYTFF